MPIWLHSSHLRFVWMQPIVETHLRDVGLLNASPFPLRVMICLPCLLYAISFGSLRFFASFHVCWFCVSFVIASAQLEQGYLEEGCNSLGASKKSKDASKKTQAQKRAKLSRLGCLASLSGPLSLSTFTRTMYYDFLSLYIA